MQQLAIHSNGGVVTNAKALIVVVPDSTQVTVDAVTDGKMGSYYPATLTPSQKDMLIDGKHIALNPGMNVTAEIKTGKRRSIEFLLSRLYRAGNESLRER